MIITCAYSLMEVRENWFMFQWNLFLGAQMIAAVLVSVELTHWILEDVAVFSNMEFSSTLWWVILRTVSMKIAISLMPAGLTDKINSDFVNSLVPSGNKPLLKQCWPRSLSSYEKSLARPQWVKVTDGIQVIRISIPCQSAMPKIWHRHRLW